MKKLLNETGSTVFGGAQRTEPGINFIGKIARFFSTKGAKAFAKAEEEGILGTGMATDTVDPRPAYNKDPDSGMGMSRQGILPEIEYTRKERYKRFEEMDHYPEIGSAFDIFADDCTQVSVEKKRFIIKTENEKIKQEIEILFHRLKLEGIYWEIFRNMVKYGDCFTELIIDLDRTSQGIKKIKILDPNYIYRVEDIYGNLEKYMQEIPDGDTINSGGFGDSAKSFIDLDKNQLTHFRLFSSDPGFYPYGRSIAAHATTVFRSLKLMEDAMLIYRLSRAPERKIFYIDVGQLPASKSEAFITRIQEKYKKEKFFNPQTGVIDSRYNPLSVDEDYFVPIRNGLNTKIETLPGAQNLGEVDDVKYFRDKLLASLKIPKDYVVEKDKSPERKANLSQLDAKFARVIERIQRNGAEGFTELAKKHLLLIGYKAEDLTDLIIELPDPSDTFTKRKLELDDARVRIAQAAMGTGLFDDKYVLKEYFNMSEEEIELLKSRVEEYKLKQIQQGMGPGGAPLPPETNPMVGGMTGIPNNQEESIDSVSYLLSEEKNIKNIKILERIKGRISKSK